MRAAVIEEDRDEIHESANLIFREDAQNQMLKRRCKTRFLGNALVEKGPTMNRAFLLFQPTKKPLH